MPCQIQLDVSPKPGDEIRVPLTVSEDGSGGIIMVTRKIQSVKNEKTLDSLNEVPIYELNIYLESP